MSKTKPTIAIYNTPMFHMEMSNVKSKELCEVPTFLKWLKLYKCS